MSQTNERAVNPGRAKPYNVMWTYILKAKSIYNRLAKVLRKVHLEDHDGHRDKPFDAERFLS